MSRLPPLGDPPSGAEGGSSGGLEDAPVLGPGTEMGQGAVLLAVAAEEEEEV